MKLCHLFESGGNKELVDYFNVRPIDDATMEDGNEYWEQVWEAFIDYLDEANQQRLVQYFGVSLDEMSASFYVGLPSKAKRMFADWLEDSYETRFILHDDPQAAPAWMLMEPVTGKLLPKNTPMVHFSDHVEDIKANGFRFGVPDVNKIALTREDHMWVPGGRRISYNQPGYNFAYPIDMDLDLRAGGYGAGALLFQSSGMLVHHSGDQEQQIVFWGPAVNTRKGVAIHRVDSRWVTDGGNSDMSLNRLVKRVAQKNYQDFVMKKGSSPTTPSPQRRFA